MMMTMTMAMLMVMVMVLALVMAMAMTMVMLIGKDDNKNDNDNDGVDTVVCGVGNVIVHSVVIMVLVPLLLAFIIVINFHRMPIFIINAFMDADNVLRSFFLFFAKATSA